MPNYKCLTQQEFSNGEYRLVPIRFEDRYKIMKWRNEQLYLLRQAKSITKKDQQIYFYSVIAELFENEFPRQILFSFLKNDICIGYGGLVHIDYNSKHAEISMLFQTKLNLNHYKRLSFIYLNLLQKIGSELCLNKVYTFGYDFNDLRFEPLYKSGFQLDALLHEHVIVNNKIVPVRIYSKILRH